MKKDFAQTSSFIPPIIRLVAIAVFVGVPLARSGAQNRTWTASTVISGTVYPVGGSWFTGTNWSGSAVPESWENVYIGNLDFLNIQISGSTAAAGTIHVGTSGTAQLQVQESGTLNSSTTYIGENAGTKGTVGVQLYSRWDNSSSIYVGYSGSGILTINGLSSVNTFGLSLGQSGSASAGDVYLSTNSDLAASFMSVGVAGRGLVHVDRGSRVRSDYVTIGADVGSRGAVTLIEGAVWTNTNAMTIGASGSAALSISDRARVEGGYGTTFVGGNASGTGTVTLDTDGQWNSAGLRIGASGRGTVTVQGGADMTSADARLGENAGGRGVVTISGDGSTWTNTNALVVGAAGSGTLNVQDGAVVSTGSLEAGVENANGYGNLLVDGSQLNVTGPVTLGHSGSASLAVSNQGRVAGGRTVVNGRSSLAVSGTSAMTIGELSMGETNSGTATLLVQGGGTVATSNVNMAYGSRADITVTGTGSVFTATNGMTMGVFNLATLAVRDGAVAAASHFHEYADARITLNNGTLRGLADSHDFLSHFESGEVSLEGNGTIDTNGHTLWLLSEIGGGGSLTKLGFGTLVLHGAQQYQGDTIVRQGTLVFQENGSLRDGTSLRVGGAAGDNGAVAFDRFSPVELRSFILGDAAGSTGSATVTLDDVIEVGDPFGWGGSFYVGNSGAGSLTISDGRVYSRVGLIIAAAAGSSGSVLLDDPEAKFEFDNSLTIGFHGQGSFSITSGTVAGGPGGFRSVSVASGSGSGLVSVSGSNSVWSTADASMLIGSGGSGTLAVTNGGRVEVRSLAIYGHTSSAGSVSGAGSVIVAPDNFAVQVISATGRADFSVLDGATGTFGNIAVYGGSSSSLATMNVSGEGSSVSGSAVMLQSNGGTASLTVSDGASMNLASTSYIAMSSNSHGSVTVSGSNTTWLQPTGAMVVGSSGTGVLTVTDGALFSGSLVQVSSGVGSSGTLVLGGGTANPAVMFVHAISEGSGNGKIVFDGGTLLPGSSNASWINGFEDGDIILQSGGGFFNTFTRDVTITSGMTGVGGLTKFGGGILTLQGTNDYTGATSVTFGALAAGTANAFSASSAVFVANTGTLALNHLNQTISALSGSSGALVSLGSGTLTTGGGNTSTTYNGAMTGSGALVKAGTGTFTLSGARTYGGGTFLNAGAVQFDQLNALGTGGIIFNSGTLRHAAGNTADISSRTVTINAGGAFIDTNTGTVTYANSIGNNGTGSLTKLGAGRLILSGSNTYAGATFINQGILQATGGNALSNLGAVVLANTAGAGLDVINGVEYIGSLAGGGAAGGDVTLGTGGVLLTGSNNTSTTYAGRFRSAGGITDGGFLQAGSGTLTLTGSGTMGASLGVDGAGGALLLAGGAFTSGNVVVADGRLEIRDGADLHTSYNGGIGTSAGKYGTMLVTGTGSTWTDDSMFITVSIYGTGILTAASGGAITQQAGSGTVRLGVAGYLGTLNIGEYATPTTAGTINAAVVEGGADRGLVNFNHTDASSFSARLTGSLDVNQRGPGLTVLTGSSNFSGALNTNSGTLKISDGGSVTNTFTSGIGNAGANAAVIVSGSSSFWHMSSDIFLGSAGNGFLKIENGASMSDTFALLGRPGGSGAVEVTGTNSRWTNSHGVVVGYQGSGTLIVADGAKVTNFEAIVGGQANGAGTARVTGIGSTWTSTAYFSLGDSGRGTLTIADGGVVNVGLGSGTMFVGRNGAAAGTLNIGAEAGGDAVAAGTLNAARVEGGAGSGAKLVNFNHTSNLTFSPTLSGALTVNHYSGTTLLTGANSYDGGTVIEGGRLSAGHDQALGSGGILVEGGTFSVQDGVTIGNEVTLAGGVFERSLSGSLVNAVNAVSALGGRDTAARILAGVSGSTTLVTSFSATSAALNDQFRQSDVYSLEGTGSDAFVLQLSIADAGAVLFLAWLDEEANLWVNAVDGNTGNNATAAQQNFHGTFTQFQAANGSALSSYIGAWGFTDTGVWAVLNHNSDFSIVPEPSTAALVGLGLMSLLRRRRRA